MSTLNMATLTNHSVAPTPPTLTKARTILVASHGGPTGAAAVRIGGLIANRWGARVELVGAIRPFVLTSPEVTVDPIEIETTERQALASAFNEQIASGSMDPKDVPVHLIVGDPVETIITTARRRRAGLIVLGLGHQQPLDRMLGGQTPIRILRRADVPLLAVPANMTKLPQSVVIATDFSEHALAAAFMALSLASDGTVAHLLHVRTEMYQRMARNSLNEGWVRIITEGTEALLEEQRQTLAHAFPHLSIQSMIRCGEAARVIQAVATEVQADLVATGSHGKSNTQRWLLGSVAEGLLHASQCAVLVASARVRDYLTLNASSPPILHT